MGSASYIELVMALKLESALQRRMHLCESDTSIGCVTKRHARLKSIFRFAVVCRICLSGVLFGCGLILFFFPVRSTFISLDFQDEREGRNRFYSVLS